jgi:hypothetical protein
MPDLDRITASSEQARPPLPRGNKNNDSHEFVDVILHDKQENSRQFVMVLCRGRRLKGRDGV